MVLPPVDARLVDFVPLGSVTLKRWMFPVLDNSGVEVLPSAGTNAHIFVVTRTARGAEVRVKSSDALQVSTVRRRLWSEASLRFLIDRDATSAIDRMMAVERFR